DGGLERADRAGQVYRLPARQGRERAALALDQQHGPALAHDEPRGGDARGARALAVAPREREDAAPEVGGVGDGHEHVGLGAAGGPRGGRGGAGPGWAGGGRGWGGGGGGVGAPHEATALNVSGVTRPAQNSSQSAESVVAVSSPATLARSWANDAPRSCRCS